jgi:hypothetical protein
MHVFGAPTCEARAAQARVVVRVVAAVPMNGGLLEVEVGHERAAQLLRMEGERDPGHAHYPGRG